jgi:hypothetical protein
MWQWLDNLGDLLGGASTEKPKRLLHRKFHLSKPVVEWLRSSGRTHAQRLAFGELILKLESDPAQHSLPILQPNAPPGMRWARFDAHKAVFIWNPVANEIHFLTCV